MLQHKFFKDIKLAKNMLKDKLKTVARVLKRVWRFLIYDDSWASFLADAILIILIGKFVLFPAIGFAMGTDFPVVAVVSSSMDHHGRDFENWWGLYGEWYEKHNITKEEFQNFFAPNGFKKGDIVVVSGKEKFGVGDVIVYKVPGRKNPIIHRVVAMNQNTVETKGDANIAQIYFEKNISYNQIQGKAISIVPKLGWVKVGFVELLKQI